MNPLETTIKAFLDKFEMFPDANTAVSHFPQAYGLLEQACEVLSKEKYTSLTSILRKPKEVPLQDEMYDNFIFISKSYNIFVNPWYATDHNQIIGWISVSDFIREILK